MLFVNVILPVFLLAFAGYLLERKIALDKQTLTNVTLLLFAPALTFSALIRRPTDLALLSQIGSYMLLYTATFAGLAILIGRIRGFDPDVTRALILTTAMMNIGNFGLPLTYFAYGERALNTSVLNFVIFSIPLGTLAIVVAQGQNVRWGEALRNTLRIPIFHAVVLALFCKATAWQPPEFLLRAVDLLGQAAIPTMLILLGMQLAQTRLRHAWGFFSLSVALRLIAGPAVGFALAQLCGMDPETRNIVVLQTSTPAAVLTMLYAAKFNTRPDLVSGAIMLGTLTSAASLTILLYLLNGI